MKTKILLFVVALLWATNIMAFGCELPSDLVGQSNYPIGTAELIGIFGLFAFLWGAAFMRKAVAVIVEYKNFTPVSRRSTMINAVILCTSGIILCWLFCQFLFLYQKIGGIWLSLLPSIGIGILGIVIGAVIRYFVQRDFERDMNDEKPECKCCR